jgi:hypothetical protein
MFRRSPAILLPYVKGLTCSDGPFTEQLLPARLWKLLFTPKLEDYWLLPNVVHHPLSRQRHDNRPPKPTRSLPDAEAASGTNRELLAYSDHLTHELVEAHCSHRW